MKNERRPLSLSFTLLLFHVLGHGDEPVAQGREPSDAVGPTAERSETSAVPVLTDIDRR